MNRDSQSAATSSMVLPMIIEALNDIPRPDSGFEDNVIAEDIVSRLELGVDRCVEHPKVFRIANHRFAKAPGSNQHCLCSCAIGPPEITLRMLCLLAPCLYTHNGHAFPR